MNVLELFLSYPALRVVFSIAAFLLGSMVGSFLNVCIYRLPRGRSVLRPLRSYCPECHEPIAWYDNIPLLSYFILQGQCRHCGGLISRRYVVVEFITAATFVLFLNLLAMRGEAPEVIAVYVALGSTLIVCSFIDIELRIVPNEITLGGMVLAPALSVLVPALHGRPQLGRSLEFFSNEHERLAALSASLLGMIVGAFIIYAVGVMGKKIFRKEAMGFGDVKFMAFLGGLLGWKLVILILFISSIYGAVIGALLMLRTGDHHIAYVPYLSLATVTVVLWGGEIMQFTGLSYFLGL